jgi:hypothetical protein
MFKLSDPTISFILLEPVNETNTDYVNNVNCEKTCSVLYSKDYSVISIKEYSTDTNKNCYLGVTSLTNNDDIRNETLNILNFLDLESAVLKYLGDSDPVRVYKNGNEHPLKFKLYESTEGSKKYLLEGISFSFEEKIRYFFPKKKEHLKTGMVIEFLNNNKWNQKQIVDLDTEYDKLYKLLIKYDKLRISMK